MSGKIRNQKGATLILALFAVLAATLMAAAMVTAALSNLRRSAGGASSTQALYAVLSACEAVKESTGSLILEEITVSETAVSREESCPGFSGRELPDAGREIRTEGGDTVLFPLIARCITDLYLGNFAGTEADRSFIVESREAGDVTVTVKLLEDKTAVLLFSAEETETGRELILRAALSEGVSRIKQDHEYRDREGMNRICTHDYEIRTAEICWTMEETS